MFGIIRRKYCPIPPLTAWLDSKTLRRNQINPWATL